MAGNADRVLVYLVLFITDILQVCCLGPICSSNADVCFFFLLQVCAKINDKSEAAKKLNTLSLESFIVPGEKNFVLGGMYAPAGRDQGMLISLLIFVAFFLHCLAETLRQYISQLRQEIVLRIIDKIYPDGTPSKWWICFAKKRFMNKSLADSNKA